LAKQPLEIYKYNSINKTCIFLSREKPCKKTIEWML